ncbi:hypothetical protein ACFVWG_32850 [Kribbella sp. NPDC058245]|uniref:hypothetical protein n=1 Tax=Kribbella sp. NPDC058245 TaxID=3346399 RepID=UPI0036E9E921
MLQEFVPDGETPTPALVAAWLALDTLRAESVSMWAANWLVQGYGGDSLAELAGLSGRDTREVRDLLPAALADAGLTPLSSRQAALKVAYDHIANMHLSGRVRWTWVVNQIVGLVISNRYASEVFEQPLGDLWGIDDEPGEPWSRTDDELAGIVRRACVEQVQQ